MKLNSFECAKAKYILLTDGRNSMPRTSYVVRNGTIFLSLIHINQSTISRRELKLSVTIFS